MNLVLDIASSVQFWRRKYPANRAPSAPTRLLPPSGCITRAIDVRAFAESHDVFNACGISGDTLEVLALDASKQRRSKHRIVHEWRSAIPEGSFYELSPNVFVESPPFMFLQAATILSFPALIAFGDELCGLYGFDEREDRGFRRRTAPLTTKRELSRSLEQAKGCRGSAQARNALNYVVENSASPMETFDEMTMCLPYRHGGYGLPEPEMNQEAKLNERAARIAKRQKCFLDMGYLPTKLDIEHHGKYDHSSDEEVASDRARVNGLKEMGVEVVELTVDQVGDLMAYEFIIQRIARILGKRLSKEHLGATPQRLELRKELFSWNASSGRIR